MANQKNHENTRLHKALVCHNFFFQFAILYVTLQPKSLYISRVVSYFYGTEIQIWAGFGPIGNTEKRNWADYEQLLRSFFFMFPGAVLFSGIVK